MAAARLTTQMLLTGSLAGLVACAGDGAADKATGAAPEYLPVDVTLMGGDLVRVRVAVKGASDLAQLDDYARCAAAGYATKNKAGFVRHVRTTTDKEGGIWRADAVYSITSALPKGLQTIDAEVTVADCAALGIPTD